MQTAFMALALMAAASAPAVPVSVASGDWSNIPLAQQRGVLQVWPSAIEELEAALIGDCKTLNRSQRQLELSIPFLIRFGTDGSLQQVVVRRLNCPSAEAVVGRAVLQLARSGEYRPTGENSAGWYRGELNLLSDRR